MVQWMVEILQVLRINCSYIGPEVLAQLTEWLLSILENSGSNPAISRFH